LSIYLMILLFGAFRKDGLDMQVLLGAVDRTKGEEYNQIIPVERVFVHKEFKIVEIPFSAHNDIGEALCK